AEAVKVLDGILNGKGFLGRREPAEIRACAARGLGQVKNAAARTALEKASRTDDPVVRTAVSKALRGEEA
ncbi:MAG: HEAT repeat domain-containing protein, partial [Gemmatimonadetes bacterium]